MSKLFIGNPAVYGIPEDTSLPLTGVPEGTKRTRLRFRNDSFGEVFCKGDGWIRRFLLTVKDGAFIIDPAFEQGTNRTNQ